MSQLEDGKLDCLVLAAVDETAAFKEIDVYDEPLSVAVPCDHEWAKQDGVDMLQLNGQTVLALGDGHCLKTKLWASALLRVQKTMNVLKRPV